MIRFPAVRNRLLFLHIFLALLLGGLIGLAAWRLSAFPPDALSAVGVVVLVAGLVFLPAVLHRILLLFTAYYEISSSGGLALRLGSRREVIPLDTIEEIRSGSKISDSIRKAAPGWLDAWQGRVILKDEEAVDWIATDRGQGLLLLVTKSQRIAVSPADPTGFARQITDLSPHGNLEKVEPVSIRPSPLLLDILRNPQALWLLTGGLIGITGLGAFLTGIQPGLPADQPFRFDPLGVATSRGDPIRLLILPFVGGVIWLFNTILGWWAWKKGERPAAFAIWAVSLIVAIGLWAASVFLILAK